MYCMCVCVSVTYMSILIKKVQSIQIYSQDAGCLDGGGATALDVEEGGAEHGKGTDQTWAKKDAVILKESTCMISECSLEQLLSSLFSNAIF